MNPDPRHAFRFRRCAQSGNGAYFDVCAAADDHAVATVLLGDRGIPDRLKVVHPAYFYRYGNEVSGTREPALLAWLSDLAAVNAALAVVGSPAARSVSWTESVTVG